jgi:hypothetical protein
MIVVGLGKPVVAPSTNIVKTAPTKPLLLTVKLPDAAAYKKLPPRVLGTFIVPLMPGTRA